MFSMKLSFQCQRVQSVVSKILPGITSVQIQAYVHKAVMEELKRIIDDSEVSLLFTIFHISVTKAGCNVSSQILL